MLPPPAHEIHGTPFRNEGSGLLAPEKNAKACVAVKPGAKDGPDALDVPRGLGGD